MSDIEYLKTKIMELEEKMKVYENKSSESDNHEEEEKHDIHNIPAECEICHKVYKNKYILKTHMKLHGDTRTMYKCPICGKALCSKYYVIKHMKVKHPKKTLEEINESIDNEPNENNESNDNEQ